MITLQKAYQVLGLEPGTSFESIKHRYKRLVMVWHPDRMQNTDGRREAEEELKKINQAFDALRTHFDKHHRPGPTCDCQSQAASATGAGSHAHGQSAEEDQTTRDEERGRKEEETRRQEDERRRRAAAAAAEEAERKAEQDRRAAAASSEIKNAAKQQQLLHEEQLRWRMALVAGATIILLLLFASIGVAARAAITELRKHWSDQNSPADSNPPPQSPPPADTVTQPPPDDPDNPYIPWQYRFPGGNPASWRKCMEDEERKQKLRDEEQRTQDIYFTKLAIDRNQRIIDHCTTTIAQLEARLADPYVSDVEKNKLRDYRDFQARNLDIAQRELILNQQRFSQLGCAQEPN